MAVIGLDRPPAAAPFPLRFRSTQGRRSRPRESADALSSFRGRTTIVAWCNAPRLGTLGPMRSARRPSRLHVNKRFDRPDPDVGAVLNLAASRRGTRLELVCWELNADESHVGPLWELAVRHRLLKPDGIDPGNGQALFTLTERGRATLSNLKRRRR